MFGECSRRKTAVMNNQDYYEVLQVSRHADAEVIQAAYRRLALKYHPDRNPAVSAAQPWYKRINEAYEILNDPARRRAYDATLQATQAAAGTEAIASVLAQADDALRRREYYAAIAGYSKVLQGQPDHTAALHNRGVAHAACRL